MEFVYPSKLWENHPTGFRRRTLLLLFLISRRFLPNHRRRGSRVFECVQFGVWKLQLGIKEREEGEEEGKEGPPRLRCCSLKSTLRAKKGERKIIIIPLLLPSLWFSVQTELGEDSSLDLPHYNSDLNLNCVCVCGKSVCVCVFLHPLSLCSHVLPIAIWREAVSRCDTDSDPGFAS